jgi:hypothetical protein
MNTPPRGERVENVVQVFILLAVGVMAGAASFTHVHDWTMHNSPTGTPDWFGWANAVISELTPIAAGLEARRRSRHGQSIGYPITVLIASMTLSLAAQFAVAKPGVSGWLLSAVPALAFMALVKLVIGRTPATAPEPQPTKVKLSAPAGTTTAVPAPVTVPDPATVAPVTPVTPGPAPDPAGTVPATPVEKPADTTPATDDPEPFEVPAGLVMSANLLAAQHHTTTGQPITEATLADRLSIDPHTARRLLESIGAAPSTPAAPVNGHDPVKVTR